MHESTPLSRRRRLCLAVRWALSREMMTGHTNISQRAGRWAVEAADGRDAGAAPAIGHFPSGDEPTYRHHAMTY